MLAGAGGFFRDLRYILSIACLYFGIFAQLAICVWADPSWAVALGIVIVAISAMWALRSRKRLFVKNLSVHPDVSDISPNLGRIMADLYRRAGVRAQDYPLYDFRTAEGAEKTATPFGTEAAIPSAAVLNLGRSVLAVSVPLLALMDDEEERAVLAHEFIHLIEAHLYWRYIHNLFAGVVYWACVMIQMLWFFSASGGAIATSLAMGVAMWFILRNFSGDGFIIHHNPGMPDDVYLLRKANAASRIWRRTLLTASVIMAFFNPLYLAVYVFSLSMHWLAATITRAVSRVNEYRADAEVVTLGASPLSLMTALRKLRLLEERALGAAVVTKRQDSWRARLLGTHPSLKHRLRNLSAVARRQGIPAGEIKAAATGPIVIGEEHNYPLWLIQRMQAQ
ncbi:MAG: M48 family metalloprotease [Alphaproteobacteria bacterium]|nr:M48 family metalloprotease [Alphaproteobacteria bacterium]